VILQWTLGADPGACHRCALAPASSWVVVDDLEVHLCRACSGLWSVFRSALEMAARMRATNVTLPSGRPYRIRYGARP